MNLSLKKIGAVLGGALMLGATLSGAALAQETAKTLSDYAGLVAPNGAVDALFVIGQDAATADVVSAIGMSAWVGAQSGGASGDITLTSITPTALGVKRHVQFDQTAGPSYEFASATITTDKVGPFGYVTGDGIVPFLYSHNEKGPTYINGTEKKWHEEVDLTLASVASTRDTLEAQQGDNYDEIFLTVNANAVKYKYTFDQTIAPADMKSKPIWFMGKEYIVISATENDNIKLGGTDSRVILTSTNPAVTTGGADVSMDGVFSVGTSNTYKAKMTVTNGGVTESKFITSGTTEVVAGIEVFVEDAVVTTSGTNEGEAKIIVGANILKLEDGNFLKFGDGTESPWQISLDGDADTTNALDDILATQAEPYTSVPGSSNSALKPGESVIVPSGIFGITYNGVTDKNGNPPAWLTIELTATTKDLDKDGTSDKVIHVRSPDGPVLAYYDSTIAGLITQEFYVNVTEDVASANRFHLVDPTASTLSYIAATAGPGAALTAETGVAFYYENQSPVGGANSFGFFAIQEPIPYVSGSFATNLTFEYNASASAIGSFEEVNETTNGFFAYYAHYTSDGNASTFFARDTDISTTAPGSRDYFTTWGSYIESVTKTSITLKIPREQLYAEFVLGTQMDLPGAPVTATVGEDLVLGSGGTYKVAGSVSGGGGLPSTMAKTDAEVTEADYANTLLLVGGPAVNDLVRTLQTEGKLTKTIGAAGSDADIASAGAGVIELVADAFEDGSYAIVVAGSDRAGTRAAADVLAQYDANKEALAGKTVYEV